MEGIIEFHHDLMSVITLIVFFVLYTLCAIVTNCINPRAEKPLFIRLNEHLIAYPSPARLNFM